MLDCVLYYIFSFPVLKAGYEPRPLDGIGGPITQLTLVIVAPGEHLTRVRARHTVQRTRRYRDDLATLRTQQGCQ